MTERPSIRVALAQLNPTVGDVAGNRDLVAAAYEEAAAAGADLVVTPELSLVGYPPRDLLHRGALLDACEDALADLAALTGDTGGPALVVGTPERYGGPGRPLRNAAAVCADGEVVASGAKRLLPTYDVFDEDRYFEPGDAPTTVEVAGATVGLSVCEDAWNGTTVGGVDRYDADPLGDLAAAGADLLVNVSASPFHVGKGRFRESLFAGHARRNGLPVAFVDQVGANDELTFDGRSFLLAPDGEVWARSPEFESDVRAVDVPLDGSAPDPAGQPVAPGIETEAELARRAIRTGIRDYLHKSGFEDVVVGMSGGVDSSVAATLAAEALGPEHVLGVAMPARYTSDASTEDARRVAETLGIDFEVVPIEGPFTAFLDALGPVFDDRERGVTEENVQARVRGTTLMALSNEFGALVLTPDNKSESAVGYCTLYGDMVGALAPLGDCLKQRVYALADRVNAAPDPRFDGPPIPDRVIERPPSAELREDQTDADDLPPYDAVDPVVRDYMEGGLDREGLVEAGHDPAVVDRVLELLHRSEYKRWQEVPLLRITPRAFGMGWRYPLAARYDAVRGR
jgi:NAD+ synthase/NAD+ synthase (glutamine-hydrolysing)